MSNEVEKTAEKILGIIEGTDEEPNNKVSINGKEINGVKGVKVKVVENPKGSEDPKRITDEMILDCLKERKFKKVVSDIHLVEILIKKFNLQDHTAEYRIEELKKSGKIKEIYPAGAMETATQKKSTPKAKEAGKGTSSKSKLKRLKITSLDGKILNYQILGEYITLYDPKKSAGVNVKPEQLGDLIGELQELKEVIE